MINSGCFDFKLLNVIYKILYNKQNKGSNLEMTFRKNNHYRLHKRLGVRTEQSHKLIFFDFGFQPMGLEELQLAQFTPLVNYLPPFPMN